MKMMTNRPTKRSWEDVKMVITTIAITGTLAFWNLFSRLEEKTAAAASVVVETSLPVAVQIAQDIPPTPVPTQPLPTASGIIYFAQPTTTAVATGLPAAGTTSVDKAKEKSKAAAKAEAPADTGSSK